MAAAIVAGPMPDAKDAVDYCPPPSFDVVYVDADRESLSPQAREIERQLKLAGLSGIVIVPSKENRLQDHNQR